MFHYPVSNDGIIFIGFAAASLYYLSDIKMKKKEEAEITQRPRRPTFTTAPSKSFLRDNTKMDIEGDSMEDVVIDDIRVQKIDSLRDHFVSADHRNDARKKTSTPYFKLIADDDFILSDIVRKGSSNHRCEAFLRAGPRLLTHFDPKTVRAGIVTCGGLCPGLNNVIREVVLTLHHLYEVESVVGIRGGYNGMTDPTYLPVELTIDSVRDIHHQGGSILGSSRGGFDIEKMITFLKVHRINQLYVIGGDGTHRGADILGNECLARTLNISIACIPKTIDNDIDLLDRSFGFQTSVEAAQAAIMSAKCEARCNFPNGIGIVKLMGRSAGFIAVYASIASGDIDLCLIPEIKIQLYGEDGYLPFLMQRVKSQGHCVVVVAEGAGEELLGTSAGKDASGNKKLPPIGDFLKEEIYKYFKSNGEEVTVKYIDPSYMIRSIPANSSDSVYCMILAQNAVHGSMSGLTKFTTGLVNNRVVYIPISRIVATSPRVLDPKGRTWERVLSMTLQPQYQDKIDSEKLTTSDKTFI